MASGIARKISLIGVLALISTTGLVGVGGGVADASHGGVHCGDVITANKTLTADVGPCVGDGVVIGANNVTLDLNGKRIIGDGFSDAQELALDTKAGLDECALGQPARRTGDVGIRIEGRSGVTVTDSATSTTDWGGEVTGFDAGVFINKGSGNTVKKLDLHDNYNKVSPEAADHGEGISVLDSSNNTMVDNRVVHNGPYAGIGVYETRAALASTPCAQIPVGTTNGNVIGNSVSGNSPAGGGNWITDNDIAVGNTNQDDGIRLEPGVTNNTVENNRVWGNGLDGIAIFFGPAANLAGQGTTVDNFTRLNVVKKNDVKANGLHEYVGSPMSPTCPVGTSDPHPRPVVVPGNQTQPLPTPCYNQWSHRKGDGIRLFGPNSTNNATENTIGGTGVGNTVCGSGASGIRVDGGLKTDGTGARNTIQANTSGTGTGCAGNHVFGAALTFDLHDSNVAANTAAGLPPCNSNTWSGNVTHDPNDPVPNHAYNNACVVAT